MKKIIMKSLFSSAVVMLSLAACTKSTGSSNNQPVVPPVTPPAPVTRLITLPAGWKFSSVISTSFPSGIELYFFDTLFEGKKTKAFCLAFDSKKTNIEFKPVLNATPKRPSDFYKDEPGVVYACINGGFFGGNQSFSLVQFNGTVLSPNIKVVSRSFNGVNTSYYPTRAAFGITSSGQPATAWIYHVANNSDIFSYPSPAPNAEGTAPLQEPTAQFPAGATRWLTTAAIGGSPMLLKNGSRQITDVAELISVNNTGSRPRSAIGHNSNGIVLMVAVEGDNPSAGYAGLSLLELSNMMSALSCTDAMNLDGGGSTSMIASNQLLVRPGDNGVERPVISAVLIKQK
jgi:hypothetical protein